MRRSGVRLSWAAPAKPIFGGAFCLHPGRGTAASQAFATPSVIRTDGHLGSAQLPVPLHGPETPRAACHWERCHHIFESFLMCMKERSICAAWATLAPDCRRQSRGFRLACRTLWSNGVSVQNAWVIPHRDTALCNDPMALVLARSTCERGVSLFEYVVGVRVSISQGVWRWAGKALTEWKHGGRRRK